jgi:hypothetical protein
MRAKSAEDSFNWTASSDSGRPGVNPGPASVGSTQSAKFDGEQSFVPAVFKRAANEHFVVPQAIEIARIQQRDAVIEGSMNGSDACAVIGGPVHAGHTHAAETDSRDGRAVPSQQALGDTEVIRVCTHGDNLSPRMTIVNLCYLLEVELGPTLFWAQRSVATVFLHVLNPDATTHSAQAKVELGPTAFWALRSVGTYFRMSWVSSPASGEASRADRTLKPKFRPIAKKLELCVQ